MASSQAMTIQWKSLLTENTSPWKIARLVRFSIPNHGGFPYQTPRLLTGGFFPDATGGLPASDFWWFLLMTISRKGWSRWVCNGGKISEMVELPWIHHHLATNICRIFHLLHPSGPMSLGPCQAGRRILGCALLSSSQARGVGLATDVDVNAAAVVVLPRNV